MKFGDSKVTEGRLIPSLNLRILPFAYNMLITKELKLQILADIITCKTHRINSKRPTSNVISLQALGMNKKKSSSKGAHLGQESDYDMNVKQKIEEQNETEQKKTNYKENKKKEIPEVLLPVS